MVFKSIGACACSTIDQLLPLSTVCYRKSKTCDLDVGKLAEKLAGGGGHEAAAGSLLNDTIINISKMLEPII